MTTELMVLPLKSSSKGNATVICSANTKILVDCGISGKALQECLKNAEIAAEELDAIVVTHEHSDHIKGVGVVSRKYGLPVFANSRTWQRMSFAVGKLDEENIRVIETGSSFYINDIEVGTFPIPHDAAEPVGYTFEADGTKAAVATDMGVICDSVFDAVKGSRTVLLEANYDPYLLDIGSYPYELKCRIRGNRGHMCNDDSAEMAKHLAETGTKEIILGHLSEENNFPQIALETVKNALAGFDVKLWVACTENITAFNIHRKVI